MNEGMENLKEIEDLKNQPLNRIADALEEVLRLVKKDQEESKKRWEDANKEE
jgi:negative regulator of sigma E activity